MSKNSFSDNVLAGIIAVIAVVAVLIVIAWTSAWYGYTLSVMWGWFVAPLFNAPVINIAQGIALVMCFRVAHKVPRQKKDEYDLKEEMKHAFIGIPIGCAFVLLCGWVAKGFV